MSFREDLLARRLSVAARLLVERPAIPVRDVARLVGFRQAPHFAKAFRGRYGLTPMRFRAEARAHGRRTHHAPPGTLGAPADREARRAIWPPVYGVVSAAGMHGGIEPGKRIDRRRAREAQAHQRSPARRGQRGDAPTVLFGDLAHDRQTEP